MHMHMHMHLCIYALSGSQAVGGAALTAGDGGTAYIWDVRAMQLGGTLQVVTHALRVLLH